MFNVSTKNIMSTFDSYELEKREICFTESKSLKKQTYTQLTTSA